MRFKFLFLVLSGYGLFVSAENSDCVTARNAKLEMKVMESNIANLNTTRTPEGGAYKPRDLICDKQYCEVVEFEDVLIKHEPGNPDSNEDGYVAYPNIDLLTEMGRMISAAKVYEESFSRCQ